MFILCGMVRIIEFFSEILPAFTQNEHQKIFPATVHYRMDVSGAGFESEKITGSDRCLRTVDPDGGYSFDDVEKLLFVFVSMRP